MNENEKETKRTDGEGKRRRMAGRQSGKRERETFKDKGDDRGKERDGEEQ